MTRIGTGEALAFVVGESGPVQSGLAALLGTIPAVTTIRLAGDFSSLVQRLAETTPELIVLDASRWDERLVDLLTLARVEWPGVRWVVLADTVQQQQDVQASGADAVLLKGDPASNLVLAIEGLLLDS